MPRVALRMFTVYSSVVAARFCEDCLVGGQTFRKARTKSLLTSTFFDLLDVCPYLQLKKRYRINPRSASYHIICVSESEIHYAWRIQDI